MIVRKSAQELERMRRAGTVVAAALAAARERVRPGIRTLELDQIVERVITASGMTPSFKGYRGFPASICASLNEEVVHGIPGPRRLSEGDIIKIDVGAVCEGFHADSAWTFYVGETAPEPVSRLLAVSEACLWAGIEQARAGNRLSDIGHAVEQVAKKAGFDVVREYVGHGVGRELHEEPQIPNYGAPGRGPKLEQGMTLAVEPMVNAGTWRTEVLGDEWTVVTADHALSAHFEHTIAVTAGPAEVLTAPGETQLRRVGS